LISLGERRARGEIVTDRADNHATADVDRGTELLLWRQFAPTINIESTEHPTRRPAVAAKIYIDTTDNGPQATPHCQVYNVCVTPS